MKDSEGPEADLRVAASVATSFVMGEERVRFEQESQVLTERAHERRVRAAEIALNWWDGKVSTVDREMVYRYLLDVAERWNVGPASEGDSE